MDRTIRALTRHYPRRDEAVVQVLAVLDRFQGVLNPEQSDFTYDDGRVELLLSLTGVLPIPIAANTYHCPIVFWLPLDYPSKPPIVFILPSETLAVRKGKNVDAGGRVTVQYLEQWSRKSEGCSLLSLIEELIPMFSARYPVTTITPKAPARPSPPVSTQTAPLSSSAATRTASPVAQPVPPRPPPQTGSPAFNSRSHPTGPASQPPARPPLPEQSFASSRPSSIGAESAARPTRFGEPAPPNFAPPRPPPPPGSTNHSITLPPGPPPGYHPPGPQGDRMPQYSLPQRSVTAAGFVPNEFPGPLPPSLPVGLPREGQPVLLPSQAPIPQIPSDLPLGPPTPPSRPDFAGSRSAPPPRAPTLPLPGTFSMPPEPPQGRPDLSLSRPHGHPPPRPTSPTASTVRAYSPAPSSIAGPPSTYLSSPTQDGRRDLNYRRDSHESSFEPDPRNRHSRDQHDLTRPPYPSEPMGAHSSQTARSRPRLPPVEPSDRSFSSASSTVITPVHAPLRPQQPPSSERSRSVAHPSQWSHHLSSATSIASASEYDAEYGSYMPPALSSTAVSEAGGAEDRTIEERTERLSIGGGGGGSRNPQARPSHYEPYQSPPSDHRYSSPKPPANAFEPVLEAQQRQRHQSRDSIDSSQQTYDSSRSSPYYPPSSHAMPPNDSRLPPPVGSLRENGHTHPSPPQPVLQQVMRKSIVRKPPVAPVSTASSSINILDADDESPSPVAPTSLSSSSQHPSRPNLPHPLAPTSTSSSHHHQQQQQQQQQQIPPPIPPNPALLALRTRLHSKLSSALSNLHRETTETQLEPLALMHSDLLKAVPAIEDEMARLRAVRDVCLNVRDRFESVVEQGEKRMAEYEKRGEGVDVDEIVCGSTVVYTQLLDLVAEDAALEDTIYALGRGLNSGTANIDLDQFLKRVRALAREQFIKRATINKILLGLAIRRERNQQRERERSAGEVSNFGGGTRTGNGQGGRGTPTVV